MGYNGNMPESFNATLVIVDLETTGGSHAGGDRIVEIGAVRLHAGVVEAEYATLVHPERRIPPFVQRIHGISDAMVARAPRYAEVHAGFLDFCEGAVLVSHNASFDRGFLDSEARRLTGEPLTHRHLDTLRMARQLLPELARHNLDTLMAHFRIHVPPAERHRALGDARATATLYLELEAIARARGQSLARAYLKPSAVPARA